MSGTKFRVKKSETHTDSNGVEYEIGAEINQDFPIEAPAGATGKLVIVGDADVGGSLDVVGDADVGGSLDVGAGATIVGDASLKSGLTVGNQLLKDDAITMHSNDFTVNSSSEVEFKVDAATPNKKFKVTTEENSTESTLFSVAPNLGTDNSDAQNPLTMSEVNIGTSLDLYRAIMYAKYIGLTSVNDLILSSTSGKVICKVPEEFLITNVGNSSVPNTPLGLKIRRPANSTGYLQVSEYNTSTGNDTGIRLVYEGDAQAENLEVTSTLLDSNYSALQVLESGTVSTILKSNASGTSVVLGKNPGSDSSDEVINQTNVQGDKVRIKASGEVTVNAERLHFENEDHFIQPPESTGILRIYQPGSDEVPFSDESTSSPYVHTKPTGLEVSNDREGSSYIALLEQSNLSTSKYGARLAYQGSDAAEESLGLPLNYSALQSVNGSTVKNILSYRYDGADAVLSTGSGTLTVGQGSHPTQINGSSIRMDTPEMDIDLANGKIDISVTNSTSLRDARIYMSSGVEEFANLGPNDAFPNIKLSAPQGVIITDGDFVTDNTNKSDFNLQNVNFRVGDLSESWANNLSKMYFWGLPEEATVNSGLTKYDIGVDKSTGRVYYDDSQDFFSGSHIYHSESLLSSGTAVELLEGSLKASTSQNSKVLAGLVVKQQECSEDSPLKDSLDVDRTSGYLTKIIAVGDSRHKECQGFNVCNENGDIEPGDLLVTSSTPGYLMKQDDDIIRSCTVGKAMENVVFNEQGQATGVYGYLYCG